MEQEVLDVYIACDMEQEVFDVYIACDMEQEVFDVYIVHFVDIYVCSTCLCRGGGGGGESFNQRS